MKKRELISEKLARIIERELNCKVLSIGRVYGWGSGSSKWMAIIEVPGRPPFELLGEDTMADCVKFGVEREMRICPWPGSQHFLDAKS
jgi:hypothetical protein